MALRKPTLEDVQGALERSITRERRIPIVPCDSPIEDMFLWDFRKVANDQICVGRQHECQTRSGAFRLDFVLSSVTGGPHIGIECDGRDFHSAARDSQRDAAIVAACPVDKIYRLRGRDIHFRIHHTLHLLSRCEPWLFSSRGLGNLDTLCGAESMREDFIGPWTQHFPFAAIRQYLSRPRHSEDDADDTDYDGSEDNEDSTPKFPTIICWTQRSA